MPGKVKEYIDKVTAGNTVQAKFSAVITLYNEESNVEPLTRNLIESFRQAFPGMPFELVLVLNGPQDNTGSLAAKLAQQFPEITLVHLGINRGYGGGMQAGLCVAGSPIIGFLCGDEQIESADVAKVFAVALEGKYDLVKVARTVRQDGWQRVIITRIYNLLFRALYGGNSWDINGTPKVFKKEALEKLNLTAEDWFLDAQVMMQSYRLGFSIKEVPVVFKARLRGSSNVRLTTLIEFLTNMWNYKNGKG